MKLILIAVLAFTCSANAVLIGIDLGPSRVITSGTAQQPDALISVAFHALDGTALNGSMLTMDFDFGEAFARVFSFSDTNIRLNVIFSTDMAGFPGFFGEGTACLVDQEGDLFGAGAVGRASGTNGLISCALFPGTFSNGSSTGELALRPYDFYGAHYEIPLPNTPNARITSGEFRISMSSPRLLGVGPDIPTDITVPDSGTSVLLLGISLSGMLAASLQNHGRNNH